MIIFICRINKIIIMQQQQPSKKMGKSKVWQKWQKTKAKFQQQRRLHTENMGIGKNCDSPLITQYTQQCSKNVKTEQTQEEWGSNVFPKMRRISYWQFLKKKGSKCSIADIGWVKVGHPHSYYISLSSTPHSRTSTTFNSYMPTTPIKNSHRQSLPSHNTHALPKHNNPPQSPQANCRDQSQQKRFVYHRPQMRTIAECQRTNSKSSKIQSPAQIKNVQGAVSAPAIPRRRKMSNGFECRPWSGAIQQSMIQYIMARTHGSLHA